MLQNLKLKLQKGLTLYNPKTRLDDGSVRPKFFVLMENYRKESKSLIIFMMSSQKLNCKKGILIEEPFPGKNTAYVVFKKYLDVPIWILKRKYQKKGILSDIQIEKIDKDLKELRFLPKKIEERIFRAKEIKETKRNTFKMSEIATVRRLK